MENAPADPERREASNRNGDYLLFPKPIEPNFQRIDFEDDDGALDSFPVYGPEIDLSFLHIQPCWPSKFENFDEIQMSHEKICAGQPKMKKTVWNPFNELQNKPKAE